MIDWFTEVDEMSQAKRLVQDVDSEGLWRYELARPPADPGSLRAVTERSGHPLDSEYESFLRHADGWPAVFQNVDLFGTPELLGAEFDAALELVSYLEPEVLEEAAVDPAALYPVAMSAKSIDVYVMPRVSGESSAPVIWFAGDEVERYESFGAFFRAVRTRNLKQAERLRRRRSGT
jgi:hypothetical protein